MPGRVPPTSRGPGLQLVCQVCYCGQSGYPGDACWACGSARTMAACPATGWVPWGHSETVTFTELRSEYLTVDQFLEVCEEDVV